MIILLSPSKTSDPEQIVKQNFTRPKFKAEIDNLLKILQAKSINEIKSLMGISDKLANQTFGWIEDLRIDLTKENARCAIFNFTGEVYVGLNAKAMNYEDISFAQHHLRILSGLYGVLSPLDLMQLYRLEMSTKLITDKGKNLYQFWGDKITNAINEDLKSTKSDLLLNLASDEYFKTIHAKQLKANVVSVDFYELKNGKKTFISFSAKRARGLMANYIIKNRILNFDGILNFDKEGYNLENYNKEKTSISFIKG